MAARKDSGDARLALDSEVDFAGYDPYIVALTGGGPVDVTRRTSSAESANRESRKVTLMAWLRHHTA